MLAIFGMGSKKKTVCAFSDRPHPVVVSISQIRFCCVARCRIALISEKQISNFKTLKIMYTGALLFDIEVYFWGCEKPFFP